jgi:hypothetical protein
MRNIILTAISFFLTYSAAFAQRIEAENYTAMSGVGTENTFDAGGGQNVGWQETGDWMDYQVNVATAGNYFVTFRVSTPNTGMQFQLRKADGTIITTLTAPNTGGWQSFQTIGTNIAFTQGVQTFRIHTLGANGWNMNWWELTGPNALPTVSAGQDQNIAQTSLSLSGTANDADGAISSYQWSLVSGPGGSTFSSATTASTTVSSLVEGSYTFRLTVTDNSQGVSYDDVVVNVVSPYANTWSLNGNTNINPSLQFIGTTDNQPIVFKTNNVQQARIAADGTLHAKKIKVTQTGWADFVFDSTYHLMPLEQVQKFIRQNKHLPDVPSAKEVTGEGLNLGDNQAVLLRKIEELTLYVLQLNQRIKEQEEEIKKLKEKK